MTLADKIYDLSAIWRHASFVFPHFHRCGIDWDEVYRTYLNRVTETRTDREHCLLMSEFVNLLGDGHTDVSFKWNIMREIGILPFALDYAEGCYWVEGRRVLAIDGRPMDEILEEATRYVYHVGGFIPRLRYILSLILGPGEHTLETEAGTECFLMATEQPRIPRREQTEFRQVGDILYVAFDDLLRDRAPEIREKMLQACLMERI